MAKNLWNNDDFDHVFGVTPLKPIEADGVSIDSRTIAAGDVFIAVKGEQFDGHDYVAQSLDKGAAVAIVSQEIDGLAADASLLTVDDTMEAMCAMARYRRAQVGAKVVGVTGSVGKTSTKGMLAHALGACGRTHATLGNFNNHIGLPLTLARMPKDTEYSVIEMGMNHAGEIAPLAALTKPHVAIVTTVESVHLEYFENEQAIAHEKSQIFSAMEENGVAVLNRDNRHYDYMRKLVDGFANVAKVVTFGKHKEADVRLVNYRENNANQGEIEAEIHGQPLHFTLGVMGEHMACNALGVLASIDAAGADVKKAARTLENYGGTDGRGKVIKVPFDKGEYYIMDDSYNASPASIGAGIKNLVSYARRLKGGRSIAVLGDMFELGDTGPQLHEGLAENIVENGVDLVFTAGGLMKHLHDKLPKGLKGGHFKDAPEVAEALKKELKAGDVLLVKGSHGMRMDKVVTALKG